jgi:hypothetical protein
MIVDDPQRVSGRGETRRRKCKAWLTSHSAWRGAALFLVLFTIVVSLQIASGAYGSEFGGYPDEPAHYVTSLMVRDYVAQLHWFGPTQFAENYYAHYPKVAFGHWPPLLYVVQAAWMLVFSPARASVLLELALLTAMLAFSLYALARRWFGWKAAAAAGLLLACLPEIQLYTDEVMAETLLVLVTLWGVIFFARYMDSERWQDSMWFGIFSSLAVLTKGNGWEIAFMPPVALVLTRRWRLLLRPAFWLPALIVGVVCVPWQFWSFPLVHRGWTGGDAPTAAYALQAMGAFVKILGRFMGSILTAFALLGIVVTVVVPFFRSKVEPIWAAMLGLILGVWTFHLLVPAGVESRKMICAIPALILFLCAGGKWVADRLPMGSLTPWRPAVVTAMLAAAFMLQTFAIPREVYYGFTDAAQFVAGRTDRRDLKVLVSSERDGEGLLISETAMREHRPTHTFLRGTKVLSSSDWTGSAYKSAFASAPDLQKYLAKTGVGLVVIDTYSPRIRFLHHELILEAIRQNPGSWQLLRTFQGQPGSNGEVQVYGFRPNGY